VGRRAPTGAAKAGGRRKCRPTARAARRLDSKYGSIRQRNADRARADKGRQAVSRVDSCQAAAVAGMSYPAGLVILVADCGIWRRPIHGHRLRRASRARGPRGVAPTSESSERRDASVNNRPDPHAQPDQVRHDNYCERTIGSTDDESNDDRQDVEPESKPELPR
jgi:hypothetical protein